MDTANLKIINLQVLEDNMKTLRNKIFYNVKICAVVKSNSYAHTMKVVERIFPYVDYFAVFNNFEAMQVKKLLPSSLVMVIGPLTKNCLINAIKKELIFSINNFEDVLLLEQYANKYKCKINFQITINSGMNRLGMKNLVDLQKILVYIKTKPLLHFFGLFSHFGLGEKSKHIRTKTQFIRFKRFCKITTLHNIKGIKHICNSQSALQCYEYHLDMVRLGMVIYGYGHPSLCPVMSIIAKIANIQEVRKGEYIGYGEVFKTKKQMKIAILTIGYAQGLPRNYAQKGYVIINNQYAKIVGNICMDMCMVDVSNIANINIGDDAIILGKSEKLRITATDIAKKCNTIEYEILTNFNKINNIKFLE